MTPFEIKLLERIAQLENQVYVLEHESIIHYGKYSGVIFTPRIYSTNFAPYPYSTPLPNPTDN